MVAGECHGPEIDHVNQVSIVRVCNFEGWDALGIPAEKLSNENRDPRVFSRHDQTLLDSPRYLGDSVS